MIRLIGLMVSIGLADSINPTTIAPALYLATGREDARRQVLEFAAGVFVVYFLGGVVIALGPGQLLLALVPHPGRHTRYILELVAGVALVTASAFLLGYRRALARRDPPEIKADSRSSALLGATITALELPTAFPYFAAIAAAVGSGPNVLSEVLLLLIFNLCFIAPILGIAAVLTFAGPNAIRLLARGRDLLDAHWPVVLATLLLLAGLFVTFLGVTGLASAGHGELGTAARGLRGLLKH